MARPRRAEFSVRREQQPHDRPLYPTTITECWCGWSTTATNSSLYGSPNTLELALLAHRIAHLEGRVASEPTRDEERAG